MRVAAKKVASPIGPAPLYDTNYPYSPNITGNPTPALPAEFAVIFKPTS
jgi:lipoprotein plp4